MPDYDPITDLGSFTDALFAELQMLACESGGAFDGAELRQDHDDQFRVTINNRSYNVTVEATR